MCGQIRSVENDPMVIIGVRRDTRVAREETRLSRDAVGLFGARIRQDIKGRILSNFPEDITESPETPAAKKLVI